MKLAAFGRVYEVGEGSMTEIYSGMRLYLDDERKAPFGWELVRTARECIKILQTGKVVELSLDHDLAEEHYRTDWVKTTHEGAPSGYDVVVWLEEQAFAGRWDLVPRAIGSHSMNPTGRDRIRQCVRSIQQCAIRCGGSEIQLLPPIYHESEDEAAWMRLKSEET